MKTLFFICIVFLLSIEFTLSQNPQLWGTTYSGGLFNGGTIFKINGDGAGFSSKYSFHNNYYAFCDLFQAADSGLYGLTSWDGINGYGTLFRLDPITNVKSDLFSFIGSTGKNPHGNLIQLNNGLLYGMTSSGGNSNFGVIFSFDALNSTYTVLYNFNGIDGSSPNGSLMQASNGKLYGMAFDGGLYGSGVLFSFDISTNTYTNLVNFDGLNGLEPYGNLIQATNGNLYGMTNRGGVNFSGNIFSFDISNNSYIDLFDFIDTLGSRPYGSLVQANNGKLYGMTSQGGYDYSGVIFSFDLTGNIYNDLHDFGIDGDSPLGNLIQGVNGIMYGTTTTGGANGTGIIFSLNIINNSYTKLIDFIPSVASNPNGSLIQVSNGKFYGMAMHGGLNNSGAIFSYDLNTCNNLYNFPGTNGTMPEYNFIKANNGKLYGMTYWGGAKNNGALYSFDPVNNVYSDLYDFDGAHGAIPLGGLMQSSNGLLYGMTEYGGLNNKGVLFSYNISTNTYTDLFHFIDSTGALPWVSSLIELSDNKLYGTTYEGGSNNLGVIFSFDPINNTYTDLYDFVWSTGRNPRANLMQASNTKLYGIARGGINNSGVIFSFDVGANSYNVVYDFIDSTGSLPRSTLLQLTNGIMYGTTGFGGVNDLGVIYTFDPMNNTYIDIFDFDSTNGSSPSRNLIIANNGIIYGTASMGGSSDNGVLFSLDPSNNSYTKIFDFDGDNGTGPIGLLQMDPSIGINEFSSDDEIQLYPTPMTSFSILHLNEKVKDADVIIIDMTGKEILKKKLTGDRMEIKRENLERGTYLVKVIDGKKQYLNKLIVQ